MYLFHSFKSSAPQKHHVTYPKYMSIPKWHPPSMKISGLHVFVMWSSRTWGMWYTISIWYTMAPSHVANFCCFSFQSVLQAQKLVKLEEMVGQGVQEEEPEGEVIAGPSGEAVESWSSGYTPSFSLELNYLLFWWYSFITAWVYCMSPPSFFKNWSIWSILNTFAYQTL